MESFLQLIWGKITRCKCGRERKAKRDTRAQRLRAGYHLKREVQMNSRQKIRQREHFFLATHWQFLLVRCPKS